MLKSYMSLASDHQQALYEIQDVTLITIKLLAAGPVIADPTV
jgi:hypothetical protein